MYFNHVATFLSFLQIILGFITALMVTRRIRLKPRRAQHLEEDGGKVRNLLNLRNYTLSMAEL